MRRQSVSAALVLFLTIAAAKAQDKEQKTTPSTSAPSSLPARAPTGVPPVSSDVAQPNIDPQLRADILRLLEVTHSIARAQMGIRVAFEAMRPHLLSAIPATPNRDKIVADYGEKMTALPETPEFTDGLVAVYARYFSDEDIKALASFYDSPAGRHFNEHAAEVAANSMRFGQQLAAQHMGRIFAQVCEDYPELDGRAKFCATPDTDASHLASSSKPASASQQK